MFWQAWTILCCFAAQLHSTHSQKFGSRGPQEKALVLAKVLISNKQFRQNPIQLKGKGSPDVLKAPESGSVIPCLHCRLCLACCAWYVSLPGLQCSQAGFSITKWMLMLCLQHRPEGLEHMSIAIHIVYSAFVMIRSIGGSEACQASPCIPIGHICELRSVNHKCCKFTCFVLFE